MRALVSAVVCTVRFDILNLYIKHLRACPEVFLLDSRRCPEEDRTLSGQFTSGHPPGTSGILRASSGHFLWAFLPESFFAWVSFLPESVFTWVIFVPGISSRHFIPESFFAWVNFYLSHFSSGHFLRAFFTWVIFSLSQFFKVNMTSLWSNFAAVSAIFLMYKKILKLRYLHAFFSKNLQ